MCYHACITCCLRSYYGSIAHYYAHNTHKLYTVHNAKKKTLGLSLVLSVLFILRRGLVSHALHVSRCKMHNDSFCCFVFSNVLWCLVPCALRLSAADRLDEMGRPSRRQPIRHAEPAAAPVAQASHFTALRVGWSPSPASANALTLFRFPRRLLPCLTSFLFRSPALAKSPTSPPTNADAAESNNSVAGNGFVS